MTSRSSLLPPHNALALFGVLSLFGCRNLDQFTSKPGEAYCGPIIGQPEFQDGFVKQGEPPDLELALTLDTNRLTSQPGRLSSGDAANGMCAAPGAPQALFDNVPLRAIPAVDHDVLSALTFGEGHEHDFFAWVDSTCQGTMLSVVSLMKNGQVELRLFKPERMPAPDATPAEVPGFAVFHLQAQQRSDCKVFQ
jgi:hypothetical protein